ncbi:MAG TPA: hypothetical protein VMT82_09365 [candidate division Zixibacteria bacterium]|nr:hypothetical protein [candidate division Zixibacteria bacterium]
MPTIFFARGPYLVWLLLPLRRLELLRALPARLLELLALRVDARFARVRVRDRLLDEEDDRREADRLLLDLLVVPARRRPVLLARFLPVDLRACDLVDDAFRVLRLLFPLRLRVPDERLLVCAISYSKPLRAAHPPTSRWHASLHGLASCLFRRNHMATSCRRLESRVTSQRLLLAHKARSAAM